MAGRESAPSGTLTSIRSPFTIIKQVANRAGEDVDGGIEELSFHNFLDPQALLTTTMVAMTATVARTTPMAVTTVMMIVRTGMIPTVTGTMPMATGVAIVIVMGVFRIMIMIIIMRIMMTARAVPASMVFPCIGIPVCHDLLLQF